MVKVRGAELKTKGGPKLKIKGPKLFFGKFYILKKKNFGPRRGPSPLCPSPGFVPGWGLWLWEVVAVAVDVAVVAAGWGFFFFYYFWWW